MNWEPWKSVHTRAHRHSQLQSHKAQKCSRVPGTTQVRYSWWELQDSVVWHTKRLSPRLDNSSQGSVTPERTLG